jgi:hypothetical protein
MKARFKFVGQVPWVRRTPPKAFRPEAAPTLVANGVPQRMGGGGAPVVFGGFGGCSFDWSQPCNDRHTIVTVLGDALSGSENEAGESLPECDSARTRGGRRPAQAVSRATAKQFLACSAGVIQDSVAASTSTRQIGAYQCLQGRRTNSANAFFRVRPRMGAAALPSPFRSTPDYGHSCADSDARGICRWPMDHFKISSDRSAVREQAPFHSICLLGWWNDVIVSMWSLKPGREILDPLSKSSNTLPR